jgi:hypothetical protein
MQRLDAAPLATMHAISCHGRPSASRSRTDSADRLPRFRI